MSKTLTTLKFHLSALRDMYVIPAQAIETRNEVRRIIKSFESNIGDMRYEELESASLLTGSK